MKSQTKMSHFLDNPRALMVVSILLAVVLWCFVTMSIRTETEGMLRNLPVDFDYAAQMYQEQGLSIVSREDIAVAVKVYGDGASVGSLNSNDIVVYPDYSQVKTPGEMNVNLLVKITNSKLENKVNAEIASENNSINIVFDANETKEFAIDINTNGLTTASDFILNKVTCSPATVMVSGPKSEIERITNAEVTIDLAEELSSSKTVEGRIRLLNDSGNDAELDYCTVSSSVTEVQYSVYQTAELPLVVEFINTPPGFDAESLPYALSKRTLQVSGPSNLISTLSGLSVGYFDLSTFELDRDYQLTVNIPTGIIPQQNINNVTLSFDSTGLAEKVFNIKNINAVNIPANYQMNIKTKTLENVRLIGPKEVMENLSASSVVAEVNAEDIQVTVGTENLAVVPYVPAEKRIFATGTYNVQCEITSN